MPSPAAAVATASVHAIACSWPCGLKAHYGNEASDRAKRVEVALRSFRDGEFKVEGWGGIPGVTGGGQQKLLR